MVCGARLLPSKKSRCLGGSSGFDSRCSNNRIPSSVAFSFFYETRFHRGTNAIICNENRMLHIDHTQCQIIVDS
jgi:hypothetical protein